MTHIYCKLSTFFAGNEAGIGINRQRYFLPTYWLILFSLQPTKFAINMKAEGCFSAISKKLKAKARQNE